MHMREQYGTPGWHTLGQSKYVATPVSGAFGETMIHYLDAELHPTEF